jgi:hypothetical protein
MDASGATAQPGIESFTMAGTSVPFEHALKQPHEIHVYLLPRQSSSIFFYAHVTMMPACRAGIPGNPGTGELLPDPAG